MVAATSPKESAAQSEPDFELAVSVPVPVISTATADLFTGDGTVVAIFLAFSRPARPCRSP